MPLALQARLLRVLAEKEVLRLGATRPLPVDIRVMAATHADLEASPGRETSATISITASTAPC